jgi:hypothetical protein
MDVLYDRNARLATLWIFTWLDWKISNWIATHSPVPIADRSSTSVHELLATANASATDATNLPRNANRTSYAKRARNLYAGATGKESRNTTRRNKEENERIEVSDKMPFGMGPIGFFLPCYWPYSPYYPWGSPYYPELYTPYPELPKEQEITMLEDEKAYIEHRIKEIDERLKELKK